MTNDARELIHIRLPRWLVKKLDHWAVDQDIYRQSAVEMLLTKALEEYIYGSVEQVEVRLGWERCGVILVPAQTRYEDDITCFLPKGHRGNHARGNRLGQGSDPR